MTFLKTTYDWLFTGTLLVLGLGILGALIRAIRGPRIAARIVAINMIGTMTVLAIAVLSVLLDQPYLLDVCLLYVLISFLSVVVLTKVFIAVYRGRRQKKPSASGTKEDEP